MNVISMFKKEVIVPVTIAATISLFLVVSAVQATTTISTDVTTGGALSVTGLSTLLGGATTTSITLLNGETISNASDGVIQLLGVASTTSLTLLNGETITNAVDGTIALTGAATVSGTLGVTGTATHSGLTTLTGTTTLAQSLILAKTVAPSCIEMYATSTETKVKLTFYATSTSLVAADGVGMLIYGYGTCN